MDSKKQWNRWRNIVCDACDQLEGVDDEIEKLPKDQRLLVSFEGAYSGMGDLVRSIEWSMGRLGIKIESEKEGKEDTKVVEG